MIDPNIFDEELPSIDIYVFDDDQLKNYINRLCNQPISYRSLKVKPNTIFLKIEEKEYSNKNSKDIFYKALCEGKIIWINKRYFY